MTVLLYLSYLSRLTKAEELIIDKEVGANRLAVIKFLKKAYGKSKIIIISTALGLFILVSTPKNANVISVTATLQPPVMRQSIKFVPNYTRLKVEKHDKITFRINKMVKQMDQTYFDVPKNRMISANELVKLRGGDMSPLTKALFRLILIWVIEQGYTPTTGFSPSQINPGFGHLGQASLALPIAPRLQENPLNRNNPGQEACRAKQKNQDGTLTREQRRNLPSPDDLIISEQNVIIRDGQARYKIKNHGHDFGIQSIPNPKGRFKTEKTPENIQIFKEEIKNLVLNGERIEGTYRKAEPDGYPVSHFYDPITRKNAIFKEETTELVSAWKLTQGQVDDLLTNGNVGEY